MAIEGPLLYYFVVPSLLFVGILLFWLVQSVSLLFISRHFFFPIFYRHKITEWFVVQIGIAIHEISHFFAALLTGSKINLKESFITSRAGRISASTSPSIGGWISTVIAAFAPAFLPGLVLFLASVIILEIHVPFSDIFSVDPFSLDSGIFLGLLFSILSPLFNGLVSALFEPSLLGTLLLYFVMISSLTASPSEDDWKASAGVLFSFPIIPLFILFLLINFVAMQFDFNFTLIVLVGVSIIFLYVAFGVFLLSCLAILLKILSITLRSVSKRCSGARND